MPGPGLIVLRSNLQQLQLRLSMASVLYQMLSALTVISSFVIFLRLCLSLNPHDL